MKNWPKHPSIYEINTWVWLHELSVKHQRMITFANVPEETWDDMGSLDFDAVWFMGVWEKSPAGIDIANKNADLLASFRQALPDYRDLFGSLKTMMGAGLPWKTHLFCLNDF